MRGQKEQQRAGVTPSPDQVLRAPSHIGVENQAEVRQAAEHALEAMADGKGTLVIDLSRTEYVDTSGLGTLAMIHRRASEGRHTVTLRKANEEIRFALVLACLEGLFEIDAPLAGDG